MIRSLATVCAFFLLCFQSGLAQDSIDLKIKEIDISSFPVVLLKLDIRRNGNLLKQFTESNFMVFENKVSQLVESITCPGDSTTRLSISLLLDRSRSMALKPNTTNVVDSTKMNSAKFATRLFLEQLDARDEACVYSFASGDPGYTFFQVNQNFTHDTAALKRSLVPISGLGGTWIWRAMLRSIDSLKSRAGRPFLVVLTDGKSQGEEPVYTSTMVVTAAQRYKIPVYIIGLGSDVDETRLRNISNSTGGKYYRSPDATTLEQIFRQLAAEIITDACMLRYTSTNPCLDGSLRLVDVEVHAPGGVYDEDSSAFTVPRNLSPVTLSVGVSQEIGSRTSFRVPILIQEFLSVISPMTYAFTLSYDPGMITFDSVVTAGTMSVGGAVDAVILSPGRLRVSLLNHLPFTPTGLLVDIAFTTHGTPDSLVTAFRLSDAALSQQCPTNVTTNDGSMTILPCEVVYAIGNTETFVVKAGESLRFPIRIRPGIATATKYVMNLGIRYLEADLEYLGIDSSRTLSERGTILATKAKDMILLTLRGVSVDSTDRVVDVIFYAKPRTTSAVTEIEVFGSDISTDCRVLAQSEVPTVLINGECEQILIRRPAAQTITNHPNPFYQNGGPGAGNASLTRLRFSVVDDRSFVRVSIFDATGKEIAVPVETTMQAGIYSYDFRAAGLPAGTYFAVLATPQGKTVHPMLLLR
jgi:hypothetical protein